MHIPLPLQEQEGSLHALRVVIGSDMIARVPPRQLGGAHGVRPRLLLHPTDTASPMSFTVGKTDDEDLWSIQPEDSHCCHALYLGGQTMITESAGHKHTIAKANPWPVPSARS